MNDVELDRAFGFVVHDVARLLAKRFDQRAKSLGLTRAQWRALAFLAREEGISQARLSDILEVEPITLVRLVDRMEEAGWVVRRPHPTDRRLRLLFLTEKARDTFARMRVITRTCAGLMRRGLRGFNARPAIARVADSLLTPMPRPLETYFRIVSQPPISSNISSDS